MNIKRWQYAGRTIKKQCGQKTNICLKHCKRNFKLHWSTVVQCIAINVTLKRNLVPKMQPFSLTNSDKAIYPPPSPNIKGRHRIHITFQHPETREINHSDLLCSVWYICYCLFLFYFVLALWEPEEATNWIDINSTQGCQRPVNKCLPCHKICPSIDPWPCVPLHVFHRLLANWWKILINFDGII